MQRSGKIGFLLVAAILFAGFDYGACTKCYSCLSTNPTFLKKCEDPFLGEFQAEECSPTMIQKFAQQMYNVDSQLADYLSTSVAPGGPNPDVPMACQKIVMTKFNNETVVYRACQLDTQSKLAEVCKRIYNLKTDIISKVEFCGSCRTDGCNGASSHGLAASVAFAVIIGSFLVKRATATLR